MIQIIPILGFAEVFNIYAISDIDSVNGFIVWEVNKAL